MIVTGQATTIAGLTESVEFSSANINTQQKSIDIVKKSLVEANRDLRPSVPDLGLWRPLGNNVIEKLSTS